MVLKLEWASESFGGLIKTQIAGSTPRDSDSVVHGNTYQATGIAIGGKKVGEVGTHKMNTESMPREVHN